MRMAAQRRTAGMEERSTRESMVVEGICFGWRQMKSGATSQAAAWRSRSQKRSSSEASEQLKHLNEVYQHKEGKDKTRWCDIHASDPGRWAGGYYIHLGNGRASLSLSLAAERARELLAGRSESLRGL